MENKYNKIIEKNKLKKENKLNLFSLKTNTLNSLFDVEHFLHNSKKILNTINLYKILKK